MLLLSVLLLAAWAGPAAAWRPVGGSSSSRLLQAVASPNQCEGLDCLMHSKCIKFSCECGPPENPGTYAILVTKSYSCEFTDFWACARTDRGQEAPMSVCIGTEQQSAYGGPFCGDPSAEAGCPTCSTFIMASYLVPRNTRSISLFTHDTGIHSVATPPPDWTQPLCGGLDEDAALGCSRMCNLTKTLSEIGCRATCPGPVPTCANASPGTSPPVRYTCKRGRYDPAKDSQQYPEDATCCQPTCRDSNISSAEPQAFACLRGVYDASKADAVQPSTGACCMPTCGDASLSSADPAPFACPGGVPDPGSLGSVEVTPQACCLPTCGSSNVSSSEAVPYSCPDGWTFNDVGSSSTWPSDTTCCTKEGGPGPDLDLKLTKSGPSRMQIVDQPFSYRLLVEVVDGTDGIDSAAVQDNLPNGLVVVPPLPAECTSDQGQIVSCEVGQLGFAQSKAFNISIRAVQAGSFTNLAEIVVSTPLDRDQPKTAGISTNNQATAAVTVLGACCNAGSCFHSRADDCTAGGGGFSADKNCTQARCFVATCGDSNPEKPNEEWSCNSKTVFNSANRELSPPSFSSCCLPTCSNTDVNSAVPQPMECPPDNELNPATLDDTLVNEPNCCRLIPHYPADAVPSLIAQVMRSKKSGNGYVFVPSAGDPGSHVSVVGQVVQYKTTVSVNGLSGWVAKGVTVQDSLPLGMGFVGKAPAGCSFRSDRQVMSCQPFDLQWNENRVFVYNATSKWAGRHENSVVVDLQNDPDPTNNQASAVIDVLGACCDDGTGAYKCTDRSSDDCDTLRGTFTDTKSCMDNVTCKAPAGACCIPNVRCSVTTQKACKGRWKPNASCTLGSFCPIRPANGSCCTKATGSCSITSEAGCRSPGQAWSLNNKCTEQTCPKPPLKGACCSFNNGSCAQTPQADCRGDRWQEGQPCSSSSCPKLQCVTKWRPCDPATSNSSAKCCPGSSCQAVADVFPGSPASACKPDGQCVAAGKPCGDSPGGGVCCKGLACRATSFAKPRTCVLAPERCGVEADVCSSDDDCCSTFRCNSQGKCKKSVCTRNCSLQACTEDQRKDCERLQAALQSAVAQSA